MSTCVVAAERRHFLVDLDVKDAAIGNSASDDLLVREILGAAVGEHLRGQMRRGPGLSAGSDAEPVVNTNRKVTSGDLPGSVTVRIWAPAAAASSSNAASQFHLSPPRAGPR